ncbi:hypothetical protein ABN448_25810 [Delftia acidovorans]|uniref:hypothetical protein n=1 Tax=Delftia acidovorans TaxID=80866 RepID=UPI0032DF7BB8
MAIIQGGLSRLYIRYPNIDLKKIKIIAWGAGQFLRDLYPLVGIKAEYTICPHSENQGKIIHNLEVKSPDYLLKNEDPKSVLILIFSASFVEVSHQIGSLGNFQSIPAIEYGTQSNHIAEELLLLQKNIHLVPPQKEHYSEIGFFTQGPIFAFTELALAYQRFQYPNDYHCFATDAGQSPEALSRCARWVDEIIEVQLPEVPGPLRRNYMIRTAKAGAENIQKKGIKYSVRLRSGNVAIGNVRKYIQTTFGHQGSYFPGRIGFHMGWTMRNIPFQISEAFMVARAEDMLSLWSIEEDQRHEDDPSILFSPEMHHSDLARSTNENFVWSTYAKNIGYANNTIEDYLLFMREKLVPVEPELTTYSLKYTPLFGMEFDSNINPDTKWWNNLANNSGNTEHRVMEIFKRNSSIADHYARRIG